MSGLTTDSGSQNQGTSTHAITFDFVVLKGKLQVFVFEPQNCTESEQAIFSPAIEYVKDLAGACEKTPENTRYTGSSTKPPAVPLQGTEWLDSMFQTLLPGGSVSPYDVQLGYTARKDESATIQIAKNWLQEAIEDALIHYKFVLPVGLSIELHSEFDVRNESRSEGLGESNGSGDNFWRVTREAAAAGSLLVYSAKAENYF